MLDDHDAGRPAPEAAGRRRRAVPLKKVDSNFYAQHSKHMFHFEPTEYNSYNANVWTVALEEKDVVIFPSTIQHEVLTNNSSEDRICIAFNTFVRGYVGEKGLFESNYQIIK